MRLPGRIPAGSVTPALVELVDLAPTLCAVAGLPVPKTMQGRSLTHLLDGAAPQTHRDHVIVEYAQNDEVMIRDRRWKLVYERGAQRRTDGYDTGLPLERHRLRLFDLENDPRELVSVTGKPQNAETVARLQKLLVEHLIKTARQPELVPRSDDPRVILDYCVQSRDVPNPAQP
jgi:choline-sulfatase